MRGIPGRVRCLERALKGNKWLPVTPGHTVPAPVRSGPTTAHTCYVPVQTTAPTLSVNGTTAAQGPSSEPKHLCTTTFTVRQNAGDLKHRSSAPIIFRGPIIP